ncbi:MAG TPA: MASE1 domain-containing protein [Enhygromyxa sp.]|nr:MASE1 domain-containing protein [Enhygromyxa sp.]
MLGLAGLYVIAGRLGLELAHFQPNATLIWAPTGISLAALVLFGRRVWPGIFIGSAITNAMIDTSPLPLLVIAVGNTLEAVVGALLLEKVARFDPALARLRDVIGFLIYGALLSTTVSATIGVGALHLAGAVDAASFSTVWMIWWLGDAAGATVVAPLLLVGIGGRPPWRVIAQRVETWIVLALLVLLLLFAFVVTPPGPTEALLPSLLVYPVLVWVGLRLGPRGAIVGSCLASVTAVVGTARGLGPFADGVATGSSLFLVWAYVSSMGTVAMVLAAAVAEREDADLRRQRGEEERARLTTRVQHAQRLQSLGILAGGVAHDFNNLLVAIRGSAELLKLEAGRFTPAQRHAVLDEIDAASIQAAGLCRQLLTYAGHDRIERQRLNLGAVVEDTLSLLRSTTPRTIDIQLAGERDVFIEGDRTQLGQILMNLVINATEAIGDAPGWVRVSCSVREVDPHSIDETFLPADAPAGRYAVLEVSDSGAGMSRETMERIFDPFYTTKQTGRGLGMAVVLGIVAAHEGAIKVCSQPGAGTTFEILLPLARERELPVEREPCLAPCCEPMREPSGTVLLAEDEDRVRRTTRLLLENAGFTVVEACDGSEAVERYEASPDDFDVVLLDVTMPGLNGTDALARMRTLDPELPAVLMSGYDEGRVDPASGTAFVQKPFKIDHLITCMTEAMQRGRAHAPAHSRSKVAP